MKLAISNIAWEKNEDDLVYFLMKKNGFKGLEIAPTRVWENPYEQTEDSLKFFKSNTEKQGLNLVAMQSLLFGRPELKIFETEQTRNETLEYLKKNILLASKLGIKSLVFGSPKNRIIGGIDAEVAREISIEFFSEIGSFSSKNNVCFCIEANPKDYNTDFINTTYEALDLVRSVNTKGFCLHVDLGTIILNNEDCEKVIEKSIDFISHFHISEPFLNSMSDKNLPFHKKAASTLKKLCYDNWLSIEMKKGISESNVDSVRSALEFCSYIYI